MSGALLIASVTLLGADVWYRALSRGAGSSDTLFLLLVFPVIAWLGAPWRAGPARDYPVTKMELACVAALAVGALLDATLPLALGCVGLACAGMQRAGIRPAHRHPASLALLAVTGFPWIATDLTAVAWAFRVSGATAVAGVLRVAGLDAHASGAAVYAPGLTVLVDASCAGLTALQVCVLIAALSQALADAEVRGLPGLIARVVAVAWLTNAARLLTIVALALSGGEELARGPLHEAAGLLCLALPLLLLSRTPARTTPPVPA